MFNIFKLPDVSFVLIHAPFEVLLRQAEIMQIKMPVIRNDVKKVCYSFTNS